jgi:predicted Zn-dependent protease
MHAATYVEDVDLKSRRFCRDCLDRLSEPTPAGQIPLP